ncbi:hypothetical protein VCHA37P194_70194 [Vibrio chagasii]|nr:hypothetical protein VCHA35O137_70054 [Vibrio chagasii]CAH7368517.1 hypothetical protein VCHA39P230_70194 [Vibrio chagasii]CAH7371711.1 hypothetical protein VCHA37P194_70194 [Vibrio chagasii]CAH7468432.1 hypothetical protein VCHA55O506_70193 [Vibrio chagasii]
MIYGKIFTHLLALIIFNVLSKVTVKDKQTPKTN